MMKLWREDRVGFFLVVATITNIVLFIVCRAVGGRFL